MEQTLEEVLRAWAGKGHHELSAVVAVTDYGVVLSLATKQDYSSICNLQVNVNSVTPLTQSVPPKGE